MSAHPRMLGFASTLPDGYTRDELGQVRSPARELVCGVSGRVGTVYLIPVIYPDPRSGELVLLFVHRKHFEDKADELRRHVARKGRSLGFYIKSFFREGLDLLRGLVGR